MGPPASTRTPRGARGASRRAAGSNHWLHCSVLKEPGPGPWRARLRLRSAGVAPCLPCQLLAATRIALPYGARGESLDRDTDCLSPGDDRESLAGPAGGPVGWCVWS